MSPLNVNNIFEDELPEIEEFAQVEDSPAEEMPQPKEIPNNKPIDPRTGVQFGMYEEEEIDLSNIETLSSAIIGGVDVDALDNETVFKLNLNIDMDEGKRDMRTSLGDILTDDFKISQLNTDINGLAGQLADTKDPKFAAEIESKQAEMDKLIEARPIGGPDDVGVIQETLRNMSKFAAQVYEGKANIAAAGAAGAGTGALAAGPVGAVYGTGVGAAAGFMMFNTGQMRGSMINSGIQNEIDIDIANKWATRLAPIAASVDMVGLAGQLTGMGLAKDSVEKTIKIMGGVVQEGGTEMVQGWVENLSLELMKKEQAELNGEDYGITVQEIVSGSYANLRAGATTAGGLMIGGSAMRRAAGGSGKQSTEAHRMIEDFNRKNREKEEAKKIVADAQAEKQTDRDNASKPVVPTVDEGGAPVESAPISESEKRKALSIREKVDEQLEDLMLMDDESLEAALDDMVGLASEGKGDAWSSFQSELRTTLGDEQAAEVESLMEARASALGVTTEQYLEAHQVSYENIDQDVIKGSEVVATREGGVELIPERRVKAVTEFMEDGRKIIKAFRGADVSSVVHEIGHVFRRDIGGKDLTILEKWVGIDPGGDWDMQAEEKFARGWENYLATGEAPSPDLEGAFSQFTKWMTEVYKSIQGSPIDVDFSPEVQQVFDNLLIKGNQVAQTTSQNKQVSQTLEQAEPLKSEAEWEAANTEQKRLSKEHTKAPASEKEALKDLIREQVKIMRSRLDSQDRFGLDTARAEAKVALWRARERGATQRRHGVLRKKIVKKLKAYQLKGRKSQMDSATQELITELYGLLKGMKLTDAKGRIREGAENLDSEGSQEAQALANAFADAMTRRNDTGVDMFQKLLTEITQIVETGKGLSPQSIAIQRAEGIITDAVPEIVGQGVNVRERTKTLTAKTAHETRQKEKSWGEKFATSTLGKDLIFGWGGLMELVSAYAPQGPGTSTLSQALNFFENRQQQMTEIRETLGAVRDWYMEAHELTSNTQVNRRMANDTKTIIDVGLKDEMSMSQVRQLWMYMQDATIADRLNNQGFTKKVRDNINRIMDENPGDKVFAQKLIDYWNSDEVYNAINDVYKRLMGVDLPRVGVYVPIRSEAWQTESRVRAAEDVLGQLKDDHAGRKTPETASALKDRKKKADKVGIAIQGDVGLFNGYVDEMAHFKAYAEKVRVAKLVIEDRRIRDAIIYEYGKDVYDNVVENLNDISADGRVGAEVIKYVDQFRSSFVTSTIGMNAGVMMKQLISVANYWQEMPSTAFVGGFMDIPSLMENMKALGKSDYLQNRKSNVERDLKNLQTSKEFNRFQANPTFKNLVTLNVRIGDAMAIKLGGAVYMRYLMKEKNMSKADAMALVIEKSDNTQQSGSLEQQSKMQRGGSLAKIMGTYSTGPIQAIRQEIEATRGIFRGRQAGTKGHYQKFVKTMAIYQFLVPAMYSAAASALTGDEEWEQNMVYSVILGPLGSAYSWGRLMQNQLKRFAGVKYYQDSGMLSQTISDINRAAIKIKEGDFEDLTMKDWAKALESGLILGGVGGYPISKVVGMAEGAVALDPKRAIFGTGEAKEKKKESAF